MTPKLKIIVQITSLVLLLVFTSFITIKCREWFPPTTKVRIVFEGSRFSQLPALTPLKDETLYIFKDCDFTGRQYGETITPSEVDEAIAKLEKGEK